MIELESFAQNTCRKLRERIKEHSLELASGRASSYEDYKERVGYIQAIKDCEETILLVFDETQKKTVILKQEQGVNNAKPSS